eukprot:TRINITY_DN455_c1_g2_i1.p1 TRINITY_DN455_c1_g2~~TRINITY_DN455_c1_g2_i1.p1  ORF type:complete len:511 (-),score=90.34 TRINITY_DN455_c1_g2_i1:177-1709(-)
MLNADTGTWTTVVDRPLPPRRISNDPETFEFGGKLVRSNRFRINLETWLNADVVTGVTVHGLLDEDTLPEIQPTIVCPSSLFTLDQFSTIDERLADSYCVGRACVDVCDDNVSFDVVDDFQPIFAVVLNDSNWSNGDLIATVSKNTYVYKLHDASITNGAIRLVGEINVSSPSPVVRVERDRRFPGFFAVRLEDAGEWIDDELLDIPQSTPVQGAYSGVSMLDGRARFYSFQAESDVLYSYDVSSDRWRQLQSSGLTPFLLNRNQQAPLRRVAALNNRFVLVVSAWLQARHDGSVDATKVARSLEQAVVDIYDLQQDQWFTAFTTHDIVDVAQLAIQSVNATQVRIVNKAEQTALVLDFNASDVALIECSSNDHCFTCLENNAERNVEECKWCGSTCINADFLCSKDTVLDIQKCPFMTSTDGGLTTTSVATSRSTSTSTSTSASTSTTTSTLTTNVDVNKNSTPLPLSSPPPVSVAIIVVCCLGGLLCIALIVFLCSFYEQKEEYGKEK